MIEFPNKKYKIIVIDPPWKIKKSKNKMRPNQTTWDYPVMSNTEIQSLPIQDISTEESLCFLWTTQKYLWAAKEILNGWEFKPLLTMVWEKTFGRSAGMPLFGFRWNAEFILVGYKKALQPFPKNKLIPAVFQAENIRHSQKPDRFYEMVKQLGTPRIDLFARKKRDDWDCWGDEL
jgi:N6-adenosine-specific RNA methylase IME4